MPPGIYPRKIPTVEEYLKSRSEVAENGCIEWVGATSKGGYGLAHRNNVNTTAHRMAYITYKGEIQNGLEIDHLCKNVLCINPDHLEQVSHLENVRRGEKANRTHCINGHEFTPENTYRKRVNGCRVCRLCAAQRSRNLRKLNSKAMT